MSGEQHPQELKDRARDLWVSGKFSSMRLLGEHLGLAERTLWRWHRAYLWQEMAVEVAEKKREKAVDRIADPKKVNKAHYDLFAIVNDLAKEVMGQLRARGASKKPIPAREVATIARAVRDSQLGQRLAAGMDSGDVDDAVVEIVLGDLEGEIEHKAPELPKARDADFLEKPTSLDEELPKPDEKSGPDMPGPQADNEK